MRMALSARAQAYVDRQKQKPQGGGQARQGRGEASAAPAETPEERIAMWNRAAGAAGKLFDVLRGAIPADLSKPELAEACGLTANAGTFSTYLSRLSGNGLITKDADHIRATDDLFLERRQPEHAC